MIHPLIDGLKNLPHTQIAYSSKICDTVLYTSINTLYGPITLAWTRTNGVCGCVFGQGAIALKDLHKNWPKAVFKTSQIDNCPVNSLHFIGSLFQQTVWTALYKLPAARTYTYTDLANTINRPTSVRAVANAVAQNPLAYIVPCHNVIHKNGSMHGYRWGKNLKIALRQQIPH